MSKPVPFNKNQQQVTINLEKIPDLECWEIKSAPGAALLQNNDERCHAKEFVKTYSMKKISAIVSPNGREQVVMIEYVKCIVCGAIKVLNG